MDASWDGELGCELDSVGLEGRTFDGRRLGKLVAPKSVRLESLSDGRKVLKRLGLAISLKMGLDALAVEKLPR